MKNKRIIIYCFITALAFFAIGYETARFIDQKRAADPGFYPYEFNPYYSKQNEMDSLLNLKGNIVMLGNSMIRGANWNLLLGRTDIVNRGINGDITAGFLHRMQFVLNAEPKICFIEGGTNDLARNIPVKSVVENLKEIIRILRYKKIIPVLTCVSYVTKAFPPFDSFNEKVSRLNEKIRKLALAENIYLIDLNPLISADECLKEEFAQEDGVHFNDATYQIWKVEVEKILLKAGI